MIIGKRITLQVMVVLIAGLAAMPSSASTVLGIGVQSSYKWWQPAWNNNKNVIYNNGLPSYNIYATKFKKTDHAIYGPRLQLSFASLVTLSADFMYGSSRFNGKNNKGILFSKNTADFTQYIVDSSVDFTVHEKVRLFIAFGANINRNKGKLTGMMPNDLIMVRYEIALREYFPSAGARFIFPVVRNFDMILSLGIEFLKGLEYMSKMSGLSNKGLMTTVPDMPRGSFMAYGALSDLEARYTFPEVNIALSLIGHYRILRFTQKNKDRSMLTYNNNLDHQYSLGAAVSYSFTFRTASDSDYWSPSE